MSSLLIKNGRILDPSSNVDQVCDLLIENGKVSRIERGIQAAGTPSLDASGLIVAPGFIDIHVHLREPGREDEETLESGSQAAAAGGFTSICCMPNTDPINDSPTVTHYIVQEAGRRAVTRVFPIGAISIGSAGEKLAEILADMTAVAEGVKTAEAVHALAARHGVEMPISEQVYAIVHEGRSPSDALRALMLRDPKAEEWS